MRKLLLCFIILSLSSSILFALPIIKLPTPKTTGRMSLEQALYYRRSERAYQSTSLSNYQLSQLLWAAQGITEGTWGFRTAPSAGATYPLNIYVVKKDGTYLYIPKDHSLDRKSAQDLRPLMLRASLGQRFVGEAPVIFIITADFDKTAAKYGTRAGTYVPIEAGHAAQNLLLQAVSLGLGGIPVGSFYPDAVSRSLSLPYQDNPLYMIPVGYVRK